MTRKNGEEEEGLDFILMISRKLLWKMLLRRQVDERKKSGGSEVGQGSSGADFESV